MKTKRLIALVLALTLVFCFMAMSASAATTEVQPRGTCPSCIHGYMNTYYGIKSSEANGPWSERCPNMGARHQHKYHYFEDAYTKCGMCGYKLFVGTLRREYCPYNGYVA